MTTELVILGTAGGPIPVPGRAGTSSALIVDGVVYVIDCGRGSPTQFAESGLDFAKLGGIFLTHLHVDHVGDLPGMLLYPWGTSPAPVDVWGPRGPRADTGARNAGAGGDSHGAAPLGGTHQLAGTSGLVSGILAAYNIHLTVMPLDLPLPDPATLARAHEVLTDQPDEPADDGSIQPEVILHTDAVTVSAITVAHGHAHPALAYRFDTADGSVVFSGDTRVHGNLVNLAQNADVLVHEVIDLEFLRQHGTGEDGIATMKRLHTDVTEIGAVANRAGVKSVVLNHFIPAAANTVSAASWIERASVGFTGIVIAGVDGLRVAL